MYLEKSIFFGQSRTCLPLETPRHLATRIESVLNNHQFFSYWQNKFHFPVGKSFRIYFRQWFFAKKKGKIKYDISEFAVTWYWKEGISPKHSVDKTKKTFSRKCTVQVCTYMFYLYMYIHTLRLYLQFLSLHDTRNMCTTNKHVRYIAVNMQFAIYSIFFVGTVCTPLLIHFLY